MLPALALLLLLESFAFWRFYGTHHGKKAVYRAWYAWIIDAAGIASGLFLMLMAVGLLYDDLPIQTPPREWAGPILFIIGSWQGVIHGVKWMHRIRMRT